MIRETRKLGTVTCHQSDPRWTAVCEQARADVREAIGPEATVQLVPWGQSETPGAYTWRMVGRTYDALHTAYVVVDEVAQYPPGHLDLELVVQLLGVLNVEARTEQLDRDHVLILAGAERIMPGRSGCDVRYAVVAGSGFYGWGGQRCTADLATFRVGPDDDNPETSIPVTYLGATGEADVARIIAAAAERPDPTQPLTLDELDELRVHH